jgi:hypothetical protein
VQASTDGTDQQDPWSLVPYYVLAFVVGYREQTFRDLIKRVADTLLGPGIRGVRPPAAASANPSPVAFHDTAVGSTSEMSVTVRNTGSGNLLVDPIDRDPPGVVVEQEQQAFRLANNLVGGAVIVPGSSATLTVVFAPEAEEQYKGELIIRSNAGTHKIPLSGRGAPPAAAA